MSLAVIVSTWCAFITLICSIALLTNFFGKRLGFSASNGQKIFSVVYTTASVIAMYNSFLIVLASK